MIKLKSGDSAVQQAPMLQRAASLTKSLVPLSYGVVASLPSVLLVWVMHSLVGPLTTIWRARNFGLSRLSSRRDCCKTALTVILFLCLWPDNSDRDYCLGYCSKCIFWMEAHRSSSYFLLSHLLQELACPSNRVPRRPLHCGHPKWYTGIPELNAES